MEEIAVSKFKATCIAVLKKVQRTGRPVLVTKFGQPIAQISPPIPKRLPRFGAGVGQIVGDIVAPIGDESDWEAAHSRLEPEDSGSK